VNPPETEVLEPNVGVSAVPANGVALLEAADALEVPCAFVAVTVYVRALPLASDTTIGLLEPVFVFPLDEVTVYPVILLPPVAPAVNVTDVLAIPAVAVPIVGACGTEDGVALLEALLADPVPCAFVAVTV